MTEAIDDDDALLRRVADNPYQWKRAADGSIRPTSPTMKPHSDDGGLSVDVRRLLDDPKQPQSVLAELPGHGLVEFRARVPRSHGLAVDHDPLPENYAHGNITGFAELPPKEAKRIQKEMAKAATWVRMPAGAARDGGSNPAA